MKTKWIKAIVTPQTKYINTVIKIEYGGDWNKAGTANDLETWINNISCLGSNGQGVWYWEPDCQSNWNGYGSGAFDPNTFKPSSGILDAFKVN